VIIVILTYSSTAWWPRVRYNVNMTQLSKLQRSAYMAITGTIKMTPKTATEVLLGLPPLQVMTEVEAQT
jgi:hypothetical protein